MKKLTIATLITASFFTANVLAEDSIQPNGPHRVGIGISSTGAGDLSLEKGFKLEYGYNQNDIVGYNVSLERAKMDWDGFDDTLLTLKAGTDLGYTFYADGLSIKPFVSFGLHYTEYELDAKFVNVSDSDFNIYYGAGVRVAGDHMYVQLVHETLHYDVGSLNIEPDQVGITFGWMF